MMLNACEQCGAGPSAPYHRDRAIAGAHRFRSPILTRAERHARAVGIDFDEGLHRYTIPAEDAPSGREVPGVTGILKAEGFVDYTFCSEFARERGSAAHEAIHFLCEGDLDRSSLDEVTGPYVAAAERAIAELEIQPIVAEAVVYSTRHGYAGKLDLLAYFRQAAALCLVDWKTGAPPPATALQLAGYADAWLEMTGEAVIHRIAVQLLPGHTVPYKVHAYTDRGDTAVFRGAAAAYNWKRRYL